MAHIGYAMRFVTLEVAAIILTLLMGFEMRRQRVPWRSVVVRSLIALVFLTVMIALWRGL